MNRKTPVGFATIERKRGRKKAKVIPLYRGYKGMPRGGGMTISSVIQAQQLRSPMARKVDAEQKAPFAKTEDQWLNEPNRYDIKGMDDRRKVSDGKQGDEGKTINTPNTQITNGDKNMRVNVSGKYGGSSLTDFANDTLTNGEVLKEDKWGGLLVRGRNGQTYFITLQSKLDLDTMKRTYDKTTAINIARMTPEEWELSHSDS